MKLIMNMCLPHWCTPSDYLWMLDSFPQPAENKKTKECRKITVMKNKNLLGLHTKMISSNMAHREPRTLFLKNYLCETFKETLKVDF